MRAAALLALLTLSGGCAQAVREPAPAGPAHAHLAFVSGSPSAALDVEAATATLTPAVLRAHPAPGDGPLAPCSLAGAALVSMGLNSVWAGIVRGQPSLPPPGSNILGMFDRDLRDRKIPRERPARTAEIVARAYLWNLWSINTWANTFVARSTQQACLDFVVSNPTMVEREISRRLGGPAGLVNDHYAAVEHYSPTVPRPSVDVWLSDFDGAGAMARSASWTDNPLAPCSVLRSLMMASRLSSLWQSMLEGSLRPPPPEDPIVGRYASVLSEGTVPREDPDQTMQIAARLFAVPLTAGVAFTERYLEGSTQLDCVNEIFQPGSIRARLMKEGTLPGLRE